jgi:hypothetical protein
MDTPKSPRGYVIPCVGRAGLGNELFPWLRARELALSTGRTLLPPRWFVPRLGPYLRRERDKREYFRLFRSASFSEILLREGFLATRALCPALASEVGAMGSDTSKHHPSDLGETKREGAWRVPALFTQGMRGYFKGLRMEPRQHARFLEGCARPGVVTTRIAEPYLAMHVRLGDFARASGDQVVANNNQSTPMSWFLREMKTLQVAFPRHKYIVCSDGSDEELAPLLELSHVERSGAKNALDEIFVLVRARGILGSRSTFSAWGAYLGQRPMLLAPGGNAYEPHDRVFETRTDQARDMFIRQIEGDSGC